MSNDTTAPDWLTPTGNPPDDDEVLERKLNKWLRGLSGLPAGMVRPRWTPTQAAMPPQDANWCALGIMVTDDDANPAFQNQTDDSAEMWKHEQIECLASFYGPNSQSIAKQFRDGLMVSQNNAQLNEIGLSLGTYTKLTPAPELINNQWVRRYDITIYLRRKLVRTYGIKSILDASVSFFGD